MLRLGRVGVLVALLGGTACTGKYVRETTKLKVPATPEAIARGSYIVNQSASCGSCHTTHGAGTAKDFLEAGESAERYLAGGNYLVIDGIGKLWIPNITSDVATGIGGWSDDEILRAMRDGIAQDGRLLMPMMPFSSYQYMSDVDAQAVVAYLRTVPPIKQEKKREENDLGFFGNFFIGRGVAHHKPARDVPETKRSDKLKWGQYVMRLGHCWECHSAKGMSPSDIDEKEFMSGSDEPDPILEKAVGKIYMRNLTPDPETGIGRYTPAQVKTALKNGTLLDGKKMAPPMSMFIPHLSGLEEEDLDALVAFLFSLPSVKNKIPDRELNAEWKARLGQ